MSTSDVDRLALAPDTPQSAVGSPPGIGFPAAGLPDPLILARMANEFFTALPGGQPIASPVIAPSLPVESPANVNVLSSPPATAPAAAPEVSLPSDPHFTTAPASAGAVSANPATAPVHAGPPAVPGPAGSATQGTGSNSGVPTFSFLEDARPIFSDTWTTPQSPYPQARPITEFAPAASTVAAPAAAPADDRKVADFAQPPSPTVPSAFGVVDSSAIPAFSFLEEARPLFSYPPQIPGPLPAFPGADLTQFDAEDLSLAPADSPAPAGAPGASFGFLRNTRALPALDTEQPAVVSGNEPDVPRDLNLSSYPFDAASLKRDFPILRERVNGRPLVWLDNAATTQKPQSVIDRLKYFYEHENSNVHRAAHELAARATDAYESAREKVRRFLNASSAREIVFVRGATEGINLVAQSWGGRNVHKGDEIVITWLEHHANIVPWQMLVAEKGAKLRVAPVDDSGQILLDEYEKLLGPKTRLVALPQVSNALGVVTPAAEMIEAAHRHGAKVLLDGAQSVSHMRVDVQELDCDFFVFSGHKVFAPTGIGVVYGKQEVLEQMPPWQGGGNMIQDVTFEKTLYQPPSQRFEAGTGNIADAVGLGAAIDYLDRVGMVNISRHEHGLLVYATESLLRIPGLRIIATAKEKAGVISFVMDGFRTEEIGDYLNRNGIAVRSGHHCAQPILRRFGLESTVRASLALYNTIEDIDALVTALWNLRLGQTSIA
ncbi:MAG: family 2A encapsulin nanocompartment cargo protein cysteine desulfurase [Terracidiphilus sp.]